MREAVKVSNHASFVGSFLNNATEVDVDANLC